MNKLLAILTVAVLPGLALGNGTSDHDASARNNDGMKPVVSVVAISADQAEALAKVRGDYKTRKEILESEYQAMLDAVLAKPDVDTN